MLPPLLQGRAAPARGTMARRLIHLATFCLSSKAGAGGHQGKRWI